MPDPQTIEAMAVELAGLRADAERNRWCDRMKADVRYSYERQEWTVEWEAAVTRYAHKTHPDRNAAIDAAMKGGK